MRALGCDIGNGFAFVSILRDDGVPLSALPTEWNATGMPTTVLKMDDGTLCTGKQISRSLASRGRVLRAVKRDLTNYLQVEGADVDYLEAYACVAQTVLDKGFKRLSERGYKPPHEVVLTYPAAFLSLPRTINLITEAVSKLRAPDGKPYVVCDAIPEPAAIAFDYLSGKDSDVPDETCIAVYDLGHGTFDAALVSSGVKNSNRIWTVYDYRCLGNIGGIDFDDELVYLMKQKMGEHDRLNTYNNLDESTIMEEAIRIKHLLTVEESAEACISLSNGKYYEMDISRNEFEGCIEGLVSNTVIKFNEILQEARKRGLMLDCIVLSGGSSSIPLVERKIKELVNQKYANRLKVCIHNPIAAVSYGAARYASLIQHWGTQTPIYVDEPDSSPLGRMRQLYGKISMSSSHKSSGQFTFVLDRSWGIVDEDTGELFVCISEGSVLPTTSRSFCYVPISSHISMVVGSVKDVGVCSGRVSKGNYQEVICLHCDGACAGEEYTVTLSVDRERIASIMLVSKSGHVLRME